MASVARESVEYLASALGVPRCEVKLVAEGYDPTKRVTWAVSSSGEHTDLTLLPDGGEIKHVPA